MRTRRRFDGGRKFRANLFSTRGFTEKRSLVEALEQRTLLSATIFDDAVPGTAAFADSNPVELGVKFRSSVGGYVTGIRFYKGAGNTGTHIGQLWGAAATPLGSATFTNETATGWQEVSFASPVHIDAGTTYTAAYFAPNGNYAYDANYFTSGVDSPPLHALADGAEGGNGVFMYSAVPAKPTDAAPLTAANYWVDVLFDANLTPMVTGTSPQLQQTYVSPDVSPSVTFNVPMDPTSLTSNVFLRGPGNVIVPGTVNYDSAHRTATIDPTGSLALNATYTIVVKGGAAGVKSAVGLNAMAADFTSTFRVQPTAPESLFPTSSTPANTSADDGNSVEVGVRFQADTAGVITALRFYKGAGNTGTHIGSIWNASDGSLVAQATFTDESASGWQQVTFDSPVVIAGGQTYIASYLAPNGHYAINTAYFTTGVDSGHLHAPANTSGAGNGVFLYTGAPTFPVNSFDSSNYWVDVVYFAGPLQAANSPPTATAQTVNVNEDAVATILLAGSDAESSSSELTFRIDTLPTKGVLKYNGVAVTAGQTFTGPPSNLTYAAPTTVAAGGTTDCFKFTVIDPAGEASSPATVSINVAAVNDRAVATPASVSVAEDGKVTIVLAGSDEETAASALKFRVTSLPTKGVLKYGGVAVTVGQTFTGSPANLTYEPGAETEGATSDSFNFVVIDGDSLASDPAAVSIAITKAVADGAVVLGTGGILRIGGTAGNDVITVCRTSTGKVRVTFGLTVVSESVLLSGVTEIRAWGRGGNDIITLVDLTTKGTLVGGDGNDALTGSNGDDLLIGGDGSDLLTGLGGNDVLAAGDGKDALLGGDGHDILMAGEVLAVQTAAGLRAMGVEWAASKSTTAAEAAEADRMVTDDDADVLSGGSGSDWFIMSRSATALDFLLKAGTGDVVTYVS